MRIAVDARELAGRPTGVGRYLAELLARWSRQVDGASDDITLFAPAALAMPDGCIGTGGARVDFVVTGGTCGTLWEQTRLPRAIASRADVLFCPAYSAPLLTRVPFVVALHDVSFAAHPEWFPRREGLRRRLLARAAARRAQRILTLSDFSRREIARVFGVSSDRVVVTPLAVPSRFARQASEAIDESSVRPGAMSEAPVVLYVGSLLNRRHLPDLVRAFARFARVRPAAKLVIVGENRTAPHEDPAAVARDEGVASQVDVRAYVEDAQLERLYRSASVFAFLSTYEGFGLTPLEAMAAGLPVVAYDTIVAREVYGDAAVLVPPGDVDAVASALTAATEDASTRARLRRARSICLARYSWDRTAAATLSTLRAAASRQSP